MITDAAQIPAYLAPSGTGSDHWAAIDAFLKQPVRAVGGEPCVECGEPIHASTNWKSRDRHLCGKPNCARRAKRRFEKARDAGELAAAGADPLLVAAITAEWLREPETFGTDVLDDFPLQHSLWTKHGDVVERFGSQSVYYSAAELGDDHPLVIASADAVFDDFPDSHIVMHILTGAAYRYPVDELGRTARVIMPFMVLDGRKYEVQWTSQPSLSAKVFTLGTLDMYLANESIRHVTDEGLETEWEVPVFTPAPTPRLWTPARTALSKKRDRINRARGSYLARARAVGVTHPGAEAIDPGDIFARDGYICGICEQPIDATLAWPEAGSASLDHIEPVSPSRTGVVGDHTEANVRAAHLVCNIVRGNRGD